jgi:hypothetical protein
LINKHDRSRERKLKIHTQTRVLFIKTRAALFENLAPLIFHVCSAENREDSDNEDWQAREESRTHSVKFSEDSATDKETPFVRQNTPHPKELKLKAHKLFSKDKRDEDSNLQPLSEEVSLRDLTHRWRVFLSLFVVCVLDEQHE